MKNIIGSVLSIFLIWFLWYFGMPTLASGFIGKWVILFLAIITFGAFILISDKDSYYGWSDTPQSLKVCIVSSAIVFGYIIFVPLFTTWSAFHSTQYQQLLGKVNESTITADISPINTENIVVIDQETARRLADKKISDEDRALGSQVELGEITFQKVGNKMYYVIPLLHSGFFKWVSNGDIGTPGYVMVNAVNDKDVKLVKQINGKPIHIKYQSEAYFSNNLRRHVYMNGYMTKAFTDPCFEIDDDGRPYYVYSLYEKTVGFSGENTTGALIVDVETGEMKEYKTDDVPAWVDRTQPESIVMDQVNDWGYYINGWFNPSDKDRLRMSDNLVLVYGNDGKCYFYAGLTSVGKDGSSVGFMLINSRNKSVCYYKQAGATEHGAMVSAQGKWQEKGYQSTQPRPYNIDGVWTYVMALKDNEGLVKAVAMVSVSNYELVGVGETIKDALRDYKSALHGLGNSLAPGNKQDEKSINALVTRISIDMKQGNSYYYFTIDSIRDKIFVVTSDVSEEVPLTEKGDQIHISYDENGGNIIDVRLFDNLKIITTKSAEQIKTDLYFNNVNDSLKKVQNNHDVDSKWDNLSAEEKMKAIKSVKNK